MRSIRPLLIALVSLCSLVAAQNNPVPFVNSPVVPTSAAPGSAGFELTVNGTGFVGGSVANWNGGPRTTTFISASQLQAAILVDRPRIRRHRAHHGNQSCARRNRHFKHYAGWN